MNKDYSNYVGKKLKIKNWDSPYKGQTGTLIMSRYDTCSYILEVEMPDGQTIYPYAPDHYLAQCEFIEDNFILPEKWGVLRTKDNCKVINDWATSQKDPFGSYGNTSGYIYNDLIEDGSRILLQCNLAKDYTEITFEQFEKYVLNKTTENMNNKEIIGYKLVKPEYIQAVISITDIITSGDEFKYINNWFANRTGGNFIQSLKEAGVLDLWFEPVYKREFKVGDHITIHNPDGKGWNKDRKNEVFVISRTSYDTIFVNVIGRGECGLNSGEYRHSTPEEIEAYNNVITINGYRAEYNVKASNSVNFGCKVINLMELKAIKLAFETFSKLEGKSNSDAKVKLDIEGKFTIDYSTIVKLINNLENTAVK